MRAQQTLRDACGSAADGLRGRPRQRGGLAWPLAAGMLTGWLALSGAACLMPVAPASAQEMSPPRPLDAATRAMIEEITRQAEAVTGQPVASGDAAAMLERAQAAAAAVRASGPLASPAPLAEALERAGVAASGTVARAPGGGPDGSTAASPPAPTGSRGLILFVSASMGDVELESALRAAVADGHTRVVLRGVLPGETLGAAIRRLAPLVRDRVPGSAVEIDPPAFRHAGILSVPSIVDPASGSQWRGSLALDAFRRRLEAIGGAQDGSAQAGVGQAGAAQAGAAQAGDATDGGARDVSLTHGAGGFSEQVGPETLIAEPDLEEVMKAQAAGLDYAGMRDRAYHAYWQQVALVVLPHCETGGERLFDPTVFLQQPLWDAGGRVVVAAGERINALEVRPWSHRLIVFDAGNPAQLAWAARAARDPRPAIFLASDVDRDAGWDGWARLVKRLGRPLYLLEPSLAARLSVRLVPSVIEQQGSLLHISEIGRDEVRAAASDQAVGQPQGSGG